MLFMQTPHTLATIIAEDAIISSNGVFSAERRMYIYIHDFVPPSLYEAIMNSNSKPNSYNFSANENHDLPGYLLHELHGVKDIFAEVMDMPVINKMHKEFHASNLAMSKIFTFISFASM